MFAKDRDLLVLEPAVMREAGWAAQRVFDGTGSVSGTTLTVASGSLIDAGVDEGSVVLVAGLAMEVVSRDSATTATVSMLRSDPGDSPVPGPSAVDQQVRVYSFGPQLAMVHRHVVRMLGIDPDGGGELGESAIVNPGEFVRLEALGALHLIYAAAGAPGRGGQSFRERAEGYRAMFASERERVSALIDLNGDGTADATRRPSVFALTRG